MGRITNQLMQKLIFSLAWRRCQILLHDESELLGMICKCERQSTSFWRGSFFPNAKAALRSRALTWVRRVSSEVARITVILSINHKWIDIYIYLRLCTTNQVPSSKCSVPHVVIQSHMIFPEIQELMLPRVSTTRAAKQDRVERGQHHSSKVMLDCYTLAWNFN
jgi:hypothetical protein